VKSEGVTQKHNYIISPGLVACWFIAVLTVWILAAGIAEFFPLANDSNVPRSAIEILSSWDGEHYTEIASNGYSIDGADRRRFAFFPLLPTVAGLLGGQSHAALAGILFSQICYLGCIILLNNIVLGKKPTPLHLQPGFWLLVSPLSFFFLVFYTESLFLFLTIANGFCSPQGMFQVGICFRNIARADTPNSDLPANSIFMVGSAKF